MVIGGLLSQYLPPYRDQLENLIRGLVSQSEEASFITFSPSSSHSVCIGAATRLLYNFVKQL